MPALRLAGNEEYRKRIQQEVAYLSSKGWYHSIELPTGEVIEGLHSLETLRSKLNAFPIPSDLRGKTALDIGAWTGWYSFELERRGAQVTAMDCVAPEEFFQARKLLGSRVEHITLDVDELSPHNPGVFDYVLFFGVLYHLRHPLLGLEKVCSVTREAAFVESYVTDGANPAPDDPRTPNLLEFYETDELGGQLDNWYGPNTKCLLALCRSAGFARVRLEAMVGGRACISCWRRWEPPQENPTQPAPCIHAAVNNRTQDIYFHPGKDEYVCLYFQTPEPALTLEKIRVEVDGYGAPALALAELGRGGWQVNFRCPPWLEPGPHEIRLRTLDSPFSPPFRIEKRLAWAPSPSRESATAEELPAEAAGGEPPRLTHLENSLTRTGVFRGHSNECLICRLTTPEKDLAREQVAIEIGGLRAPVLFLTDCGGGAWQLTARLPAELKPGRHRVRVRTFRSRWSNELDLQLAREDRP